MRPLDPRLRPHLAPARRELAGVLVTGVVGSVLVLAQAWVVTGLVLAALHDGDVAAAGAWVVAVLVLRGLVGWAGEVLAASAASRVGTSLRRRLVLAAAESPPGTASGEVAALITRGVAAAEPYLTRYVPALVLAAVLPPLAVIAVASQDLLSGVIVLVTLPLVPVFGALVGLATRDKAREQWTALASLSGHFVDVVRGLPTLVAHRRARAQSARIAHITDRCRVTSLATLRIAFASSAVLELVATLSVAMVAVTVGVRLAAGSLDLRTALVVLLLAPEAYWPLRRVGAEFHAAAEGVGTFEAAEVLVGNHVAEDEAEAPIGADLVLDEVSVTFAGRSTPALRPVSAVIPARGVTVVRGPSGCGKTTLLSVMATLVEPTSGTVRVGGVTVSGDAWRSQVAWLPQRPVFVAGSVADNLRLGAQQADDDSLWEALRRVALEERVRDLPGGLDCPVGEDGMTLSAGERARLALARVVLADRPWVFLDEPTAHLDPLTEQVIADTVQELASTAAVVMVAHRPAMVALAGLVLSLTADKAPTPLGAASLSRAPTPVERPADHEAAPRLDGAARALGLSTVVGALASASGVALTATAGWLIVQASTQPGVLTLLAAIVAVRMFGVARPVLRYVERLVSHDAALQLLARRRVEVYDAVVPLVPARLGRRRGDVLASIVDDVDSVVDRELRVRMPARSYAIVATLAALTAAVLLPPAGLVVALTCVVAGLGGWSVARLGAARAERDLIDARAALSARVVETLQVASELRMWQQIQHAADTVAATSDRIGRDGLAAATWSGAARALVLATTGVGVVTTAAVASTPLSQGELSGPMLALLVLIPLALAEVAAPLTEAGALSVRTRAAGQRLARLARTPPAVRDTVATASPAASAVALCEVRARWDVDAPLTTPVSFDLGPGERVGLVGPSGSGKSTVAALLLRFLDPERGRVTIGGARLLTLSLDDVRRRVGLVDDDPHLFATTLVENVRLGRPDASDAEVDDALRRARLGPWLDALPEGLDTWLGDGHGAVSGGERARIGIARSLLACHPVLVLDEPTAHLDHPTAVELAQEVLEGGARDQAVLWITHTGIGLDQVDRTIELAGPTGPWSHDEGDSARTAADRDEAGW
jgi:ATP-binding cassette subfamily C protein CydCD